MNRVLVHHAQEQGIEDGQRLRSDSTVIEAAIHKPTDSKLLVDCVRVLTRLLHEAGEYVALRYTNHNKRAKRRAMAIQHAAKAEQRVPLYRDLVTVAENTVASAQLSVEKLEQGFPAEAFQQPELGDLRASLQHYIGLADKVLDQTRRRVFDNETVPAPEKIVSIFEPHTDIIRKDRRDTLYGHKVFLTGGASGLIIDCVVERGNPADSDKAVKLATRAIKVLRTTPEQIVFDGGFSSCDNLGAIKALGIRDVAFSKAPGLAIKDMVKRTWLYQRFGWDRCAWRSYGSFRAYTWGSVIAANLVMLARHTLG